MDKTKIASKIVAEILKDLRGRKGLGDEWDQIDDEIQQEIVGRWAEIAISCLP